jgi:hypothetical protein
MVLKTSLLKRLRNVNVLSITFFLSLFLFLIIIFNIYSYFDSTARYKQNHNFSITNISNSKNKKQNVEYIAKVAKNNNQNIFLSSVSATGGNLYTFIGNQELFNKDFPNNEYPAFKRNFKIEFKPYTDIENRDLRGEYLTSANKNALNQIVNELNEYGIVSNTSNELIISSMNLSPVVSVFILLVDNTYTFLFLILLLCIMFVLFFNTTKKILEFSIQTINGQSKKRIFSKSLYKITKTFVVSAIIIIFATTVSLYFYNGFNQFPQFIISLIEFYAILFLIILLLYLISFLVVFNKKNLYVAIKGKRQLKTLMFVGVIVQFLILFIIFINVTQVFTNYKLSRESKNEFSKFNSLRNYKYLTYGMGMVQKVLPSGEMISNDTGQKNVEKFIQKKLEQNKVLFIERNSTNLGDLADTVVDPNNPFAPTKISNSLVVNNLFLSTQNIYDYNNNLLKQSDLKMSDGKNNIAYALIPHKMKNLRTNIISHSKEFFTTNDEILGKKTPNKFLPTIKTIYLKDGQNICNFNNGEDFNMGADHLPSYTNYDPTILVIPPITPANVLNSYTAYFPASVNLAQEIKDFNIEDMVSSINNVYDSAEYQINRLTLKEQNDVTAIFLSIIVLIFISIIITAIYCNANRQIIFAKFISGFSFKSIFINLLLFIFVLGATVLLISSALGKLNGKSNFIFCLVIICINLCTTYIGALHYYKQIKADYVKRY